MHTPGPWTIEQDLAEFYDISAENGAVPVGSALGPANACLIAAAPELLEALQAIVAPTGKADFGTTWKQALAAIAKATGG